MFFGRKQILLLLLLPLLPLPLLYGGLRLLHGLVLLPTFGKGDHVCCVARGLSTYLALSMSPCRCLLYLCTHVIDCLCGLQALAVASLQTLSVSWRSRSGLVVCIAGSYPWFIAVLDFVLALTLWICGVHGGLFSVGSMQTSSWS